MLGGDLSLRGPGSPGAHPEQQQGPRHHGAEEQDDALGCDEIVLGGLSHVQEWSGEPLCEEGVPLRALVPPAPPHPSLPSPAPGKTTEAPYSAAC